MESLAVAEGPSREVVSSARTALENLSACDVPNAECVEILNANGLDLRRCNLRCTTIKVLLRERNKRRGRQNNSPGAARAKAWKDKKRAEKKAATAA